MYSYKRTQDSLFDPTELVIKTFLRHQKVWAQFKEDGFLRWSGALPWWGDFWYFCRFCVWLHSPRWSSYRSQTEQPRTKIISTSCTKSKCTRNNDHHNCSNDKAHTCNILPNPYNLWDGIKQLFWHSNTLKIGTLCPISILNRRHLEIERTFFAVFIIAKEGQWKEVIARQFCILSKKIAHRTDEWTTQLLRLRSWVIFGSSEQW